MKNRYPIALAAAAALALALTSCAAQEGDAAPGGSGERPSQTAIDEAAASIQPLVDAPTDFTVTEQLESLPTGSRIAYVDCGTPICSLLGNVAQEPVGLLGMSLTTLQAGTTADSIAAAFDTIIADDYDGVLVTALPFQLWERQYEQLQDAGIAVATTGVVGMPDEFQSDLSAEQWNGRAGAWLADWVISQGEAGADSVIYRTPELAFTSAIVDAYEARVGDLCADCTVRVVDIPASAIGTTAATMIVDDLTANPDTSIAVLSIGELANGLPTALEVAGIGVPITMYGPGPAQLTDIQSGVLQSGLTLDARTLVWTLIDALARQIGGQELAAGEVNDALVAQIVTKDNLEGDQSQGWLGYLDTPERFAELWQVD